MSKDSSSVLDSAQGQAPFPAPAPAPAPEDERSSHNPPRSNKRKADELLKSQQELKRALDGVVASDKMIDDLLIEIAIGGGDSFKFLDAGSVTELLQNSSETPPNPSTTAQNPVLDAVVSRVNTVRRP